MRPETDLRNFLAGRVCLLGFGNRLWGDDGAGSLLAEELEDCPGVFAIDGGMVPENHLERVAACEPGTVLLLDAGDFGGKPGDWRLLQPGESLLAGMSTHAGSPNMLARYLEVRTNAKVGLLLIQPGGMEYGEGLSDEVANVGAALAAIFKVYADRIQ